MNNSIMLRATVFSVFLIAAHAGFLYTPTLSDVITRNLQHNDPASPPQFDQDSALNIGTSRMQHGQQSKRS